MQRVRVKICGITRLEDAIHAVNCGADALGFVFYEPSPRYVAAEFLSEVREKLPPFVTLVGLVVNPTQKAVENILKTANPDLLQFHGDETNEFCRSFDQAFIKAIRVHKDTPVAEAISQYPDANGILLDTHVTGVAGGTGACFDWSMVPKHTSKSVILAGGLNDTNVIEAIHSVKPYAVDVSSGVESQAGIKDSAKVMRFVDSVSATHQQAIDRTPQ